MYCRCTVITIIYFLNRYRQIRRALVNSNEPVLALGSVFSTTADSHLVAVQIDEEHRANAGEGIHSSDYETQAINIMNKSRKGILMFRRLILGLN